MSARSNDPSRLSPLTAAFANPGAIDGWVYRPAGLHGPAPLVVVLHGCTQTAAAYDAGSGWSRLADRAQADRRGFMLLFPQQRRRNNPNACFNWFARSDTTRGNGEAASIAAMVGALVDDGSADPERIAITGLSAGGAMAAAMLASYPELFEAGAIIAGLAAGAAEGVPEALAAMAGNGPGRAGRSPRTHQIAGRTPRVSVWHGSSDTTVVAANGDAVTAQALAAHRLPANPDEAHAIGAHERRMWRGDDGRVLVEQMRVAGMGHGVPLSTIGVAGADGFGIGRTGAHMLEAGIDSTVRIADFFGLVDMAAMAGAAPVSDAAPAAAMPGPAKAARVAMPTGPAKSFHPAPRHARPRKPASGNGRPTASGVQAVIEDALRKAGLLP